MRAALQDWVLAVLGKNTTHAQKLRRPSLVYMAQGQTSLPMTKTI